MLPHRLSKDLCSLQPDNDRLTVSVFFTLNKMGHVDDQSVRVERSTITSKARLSYEEAENIIAGNSIGMSDDITIRIKILHYLAAKRRKLRLQNERFSQDGSLETLTNFRAHFLVEEMMLLANEMIAKFLLEAYPTCTPLRRQANPDTEHVDTWQRSNSDHIPNSMSLCHRRDILVQQVGIDQNVDGDVNMQAKTMSITKDVWEDIVSATREDFTRLAGIIGTDIHYPQFARIRSALHKILKPAEYVCSGTSTTHSHGSLNMAVYTHFTSPIRRYLDIVTHRQLFAALSKNAKPQHDQQDVDKICHVCNIQSRKAREFELKARALEMAVQTTQQPIQTLAAIEEISTKKMMFSFPPIISEAVKNAKLPYNLLKPISNPEVDEGASNVTMKWKERIYSMRGVTTLSVGDIRANRNDRVAQCLETHQRFTYQIPTQDWIRIQRAIAEEDMETALQAIHALEGDIHSRLDQQPETVQEVSCEIATDDVTELRKKYVKFQRPFAIGDVLRVQLHSTKVNGILSPGVQLLNMTPALDFCLEHRAQPVHCFTNTAARLPSREGIRDIETYKKFWEPVIDMEAAYSSVSENNNVIIHGIKIEWQFPRDRKSLPCGSLSLSTAFCDARYIDYADDALKCTWMCIRYTDIDVAITTTKPEDVYVTKTRQRSSHIRKSKMTFVAHASIKDSTKKDEIKDRVNIFFEVNHTSMANFPRRLVRASATDMLECSIELIPYSFPTRRLRQAIMSMDSCDPFLQDICLLKPCTKRVEGDPAADPKGKAMAILKAEAEKRTDFLVAGCSLPPPNLSQSEALKNALSKQFTVIQGPPGTGKTITGAYLVYFFNLQNRRIPPAGDGRRPQILYCGPSNKSVDVITEYLKEEQFGLSIVRVYSKVIEDKEFPIPGVPKSTGKLETRDVEIDERHRNVSLHHLIRRHSNSMSAHIRDFDKRFRTRGYKSNPKETKEYRKLIFDAEKEELKKHQVILCTCNAAGSYRLSKTNIIQCIVDESGMCSEPETIIPLVASKPVQIVLIGDHKQLRPIIQEPTAKKLGMEISLLERYAEQMTMLRTQYRMHPAICRFPSNAFYKGELKTAEKITRRPSPIKQQIWPSRYLPIAFCHSSGPEETLSVRTADGNEMSKANPKEVGHVVRIATALVTKYGVKPSQIVILSQYRLQCSHIVDGLQQQGQSDISKISVRTVIKSQGSEWDYVIMSTVRSLPRVEIEERPNTGWRKRFLGFITDEHQMNVALTRAKYGLIIVGNQHLLRTHKKWKELIEDYGKSGCVVHANDFPRRAAQTRRR